MLQSRASLLALVDAQQSLVFGVRDKVGRADCGLRTRSWDVAFAKLENMVRGTELAKASLGL